MKKILVVLIVVGLAAYVWNQNKAAVASGHPEHSLMQKAVSAIPSQTLREKIPGSAEARKAAGNAELVTYTYTASWTDICKDLFTPLVKDSRSKNLALRKANDAAARLKRMDKELIGLQPASEAEQRLGYLGQKFNKSLLQANQNRQTIQQEVQSSLDSAKRALQGSKVEKAERDNLYLQAAGVRWEDFRKANQSTFAEQLKTLQEAEKAANAAALSSRR